MKQCRTMYIENIKKSPLEIFEVKKLAHPTFRIARIDGGWLDLAEWLERFTANSKVATVLGSIPASSDTVL
jgi:hypothetical protein